MLTFFPAPYPDELFFSVCARFHQRSGASHREMLTVLFGQPMATAVLDLPCRLEYLEKQIDAEPILTADMFIEHNTLLPLYRPFLPTDRFSKIRAWMMASDYGDRIHMSSGIMASGISAPTALRYCPICLNYEMENYGETYWHRSHQVAGVYVCHLHEAWLCEFRIDRNKHAFHTCPEAHCDSTKPIIQDSAKFKLYLMIARYVNYILNRNIDPVGLDALHEKYLIYLQRANLCTPSRRVKQKELASFFISHYGQPFLSRLNCEVHPENSDNWLSALVRKPRKSSHPIRHILLIHALGLEPKEFFSSGTNLINEHPFGSPPWPCLNPASNHYMQNVINYCSIAIQPSTQKPLGRFDCSCGFSYARVGPDIDPQDRFRIDRKISFGPEWTKRLEILASNGNSLRSIARQLHVDTNTVKKRLEHKSKKLNQKIESSSTTLELHIRRSRWLQLLKINPEFGLKKLRSCASADFAWLYRNDKNWLLDNRPPKTAKNCSPSSRVDWGARDEFLSKQVSIAANEILRIPGRPTRITISLIGKKLSCLSLLQQHMSKLPKTSYVLSQVTETREKFLIRRIKHAVSILKVNNAPLRVWNILREARIRQDISVSLSEVIHEIINAVVK